MKLFVLFQIKYLRDEKLCLEISDQAAAFIMETGHFQGDRSNFITADEDKSI